VRVDVTLQPGQVQALEQRETHQRDPHHEAAPRLEPFGDHRRAVQPQRSLAQPANGDEADQNGEWAHDQRAGQQHRSEQDRDHRARSPVAAPVDLAANPRQAERCDKRPQPI